MEWRFPFRHNTFSTRITNHEGMCVFLQLSRIHQITQFRFIHWRTYDQIRDTPHIGNIICSVMCGSVFSYQTGPVKAEYNREVLDSHIMNHLVIGSLHESGIDITEYAHPLGSHTGTQGDCMLFANTHIESAVGHLFHHELQGTAAGHGRRDSQNILVFFRELNDRISEYVLVFGWLYRFKFLLVNFSCDLIK